MPLIFFTKNAEHALTQRTTVRYTSNINRKQMNDTNGNGDRKI